MSPLQKLCWLFVLSFVAVLITLIVLTINPSNPNVQVNAGLFFNGAYTLPVDWNSVTHLSVDLAPVLADWTAEQNFTIEWFQNVFQDTNIPRIFSLGTEDNTLLEASFQGQGQAHSYLFVETVNVTQTPIYSSAIVQNTWTHFALVRKSNTMTAFANGKQIGNSFAFPYDFSTVTDTSLTLGNYSPQYANIDGILKGYMSNFRITNGALYTSTFPIPATPLPSVTQYPVSFLLQVASPATAFTDSGVYGLSVTNVGVTYINQYN